VENELNESVEGDEGRWRGFAPPADRM